MTTDKLDPVDQDFGEVYPEPWDFNYLYYVAEQTPEMCLEAVQKDGQTLRFVRNQTLDICTAAARNDASALRLVRSNDPAFYVDLIQQAPELESRLYADQLALLILGRLLVSLLGTANLKYRLAETDLD